MSDMDAAGGGGQRKEIYTYAAPWTVFAMAWSHRCVLLIKGYGILIFLNFDDHYDFVKLIVFSSFSSIFSHFRYPMIPRFADLILLLNFDWRLVPM